MPARRARFLPLALLILGLPVLAVAAQETRRQGAAISNADIAGLFGVQRLTGFEVSDYLDPAGRKWIRMRGRCETAIRAPMDEVIAKLWDFKDSPKVFSRIEAVRLRSDDGTRAVTEQRTAVRVLGLAFVSNLVFLNTLARRDEGSATVGFAMVDSDGSCMASTGGWELTELSDGEGAATFAEFWFDNIVEPRFPGQALIMRAFGADDVKRIVRELSQAIGRS
jgi:hypothetical protein